MLLDIWLHVCFESISAVLEPTDFGCMHGFVMFNASTGNRLHC